MGSLVRLGWAWRCCGRRGRREREEEGKESWWAGCSVQVNSGPGQPGQKEGQGQKLDPVQVEEKERQSKNLDLAKVENSKFMPKKNLA